jgi:hypothetical protein
MIPILTAFLGIISVYLSFGWKSAPLFKKVFIGILWAGTVILGVVAYKEQIAQSAKEEMESSVGTIRPSDLHLIPVLKFGDNTNSYFYANTLGEFDLSQLLPGAKMKLIVRDGKLVVSATIRDTSKAHVAIIEDNIWKVYDRDKFEYNNDDAGFEVITNGDRKVLFQINLIGDTAVFRGLLMSDSVGLYFLDSLGHSAALKIILPSKAKIPNTKRIFKYPRELFHKQRL